MTLGDSRVGIDINPSGSKTIAEIKRRAADLIGAVDAIELPGEAPRRDRPAQGPGDDRDRVRRHVGGQGRRAVRGRVTAPRCGGADCDHAPVILRGGGLATSAALVGRDRARP